MTRETREMREPREKSHPHHRRGDDGNAKPRPPRMMQEDAAANGEALEKALQQQKSGEKPLDVVVLCQPCHMKIHGKNYTKNSE